MKDHQISIGIIIVSILIIGGVLGKVLLAKYGKSAYQISQEELLMETGNADRLISVDEVKKIQTQKDHKYRFVDVRNTIDFSQGHLENSINIPYHRLLQPSYIRKLKEESSALILYGATLTQANSAWMILRQKQISGIKILQGFFDFETGQLVAQDQVDLPEISIAAKAQSYGEVMVAADFMELYNQQAELVIIDVNKANDYKASHIKKAINVVHSDLYQEGDIPNLMKEDSELAEYFGQKGISDQSQIVVYDEGSQKYAARVYYILKYLGVEDVRILHNNSREWKNAGIPMSSIRETLPATTFTPNPKQDIYASIDYVAANKDRAEVMLLDLRTSFEYNGTVQSKGHIPGAINISHSNLLTRSGAFKSKAELEKIAAELGLSQDKEIIFSCRTGIKAAVGFAAFKNILEYENIKLYDGSYVHWVANDKEVVK